MNSVSLSSEQVAAVQAPESVILVNAAAGSGKTRVIVERIKHLILHHGVCSNEIIAISYTRAAAREIEARLALENIKVSVRSIHSLAHHVYRFYFGATPNVTNRFPSGWSEDEIASIQNQKLHGISWLEIRDNINSVENRNLRDQFEQSLNKIEIFEKDHTGLVYDFNSLLEVATKCLNEKYFNTFSCKALIIDEFQDTSNLAMSFIDQVISIAKCSLFCVGDDWQSIFAFGGANVNIMTKFKSRHSNSQTLGLTTNYRCSREITRVSNQLISANTNQILKSTVSSSNRSGNVEIRPSTDLEDFMYSNLDEIRSIKFLFRYHLDFRIWQNPSLIPWLKFQKLLRSTGTDLEFSTIHKAKGTEADLIIILPSPMTSRRAEQDHISLKSFCAPTRTINDHREEERRVLYVAMTRARKSLLFVEAEDFITHEDFLNQEIRRIL